MNRAIGGDCSESAEESSMRVKLRLKKILMSLIPNIKFTARTPLGGSIYFRARQHKGFLIRKVGGRAHERCIFEYYRKLLRPEDVVFDIGAHIGTHTIPLGLKLPQGHVVAFEPDPDNRALLRENVLRNKLEKNVTIVPVAVSNHTGRKTFWRDLVSTSTGSLVPTRSGNSWYPEILEVPPVTIEVQTMSVDDFCASDPSCLPTLIKVDVEGAEAQVIEGMRKTIDRCHPSVIVDGTTVNAAEKLLSHGYKIYNLLNNKPVDLEAGDGVPFTILAVHEDDK